jgi:hypothetical protein
MKIAKEMREEGNAQLTIQAKYGDFSNAEEKEELALTKTTRSCWTYSLAPIRQLVARKRR